MKLTPKAQKPDWTLFQPVQVRISKLMRDGKPRSVLHVCEALDLASNCNARRVLERLQAKGELTSDFRKVGRHAVIVYRAVVGARRGRVV